MSRKNLSLLCVVAVAALLLSVIGTSHAASYDWDGTTNAWNSLHWLPGPTAGPTGPSSANIATINGGTVTFAGHDTFGNHTTPSSAVINLNGGTLASGGRFTTIWDLNMAGGTLLANGGANATYPAFQLAGTVSVTGTSASSISVGSGSNNMINVGGNGNSTLALNVADVTGNANADLTVANVLQNSPFGPSALIKTGPGTLYLSQGDNNTANTFTGPFTLAAGTLTVRASGWKDATGYGPFTQLSDTSIYLDSNNWHTLNNSHYTLNGNLGITSQNHTNRLRLATGNATLGSSLVANMEAGSYLYVDGTLDDGGNGYGITVAGGGGVVLGGANTYTGKTTILGGMLAAGSPFSNVGVAGPFGAPTGANATIDIHNGATLAYRGPQSGTPISTNRPIDLAGSGVPVASGKFA